MSHDLSINSDGKAELVLGSNTSAWHSLGTVFPSLVTKEQAIAIAMPWSAESFELLLPSKQVLAQTGVQITTNRTGRFAILRSDTAKTVGFVGEGYEVLQPSKMFDFMEGVNVSGFETAGALKGGSVLFLTAPVGEINVLNSGDITRTYLTFLNSFDGSIAAQVYLSGVRIVCRNTMNMSLSAKNGKTLKFKHTKSLHDRLAQAQNLMQAQQITEESLKVALETLATRKLKRQTFEDILSDLFPGEHTRTKNVKTEVTELFADNDGNFIPEFKGTAYNLYNAITNYADHTRDVRITKSSAQEDTTLQRYESALIGTGAELKMRALERILVLSDGSEVLESAPFTSLPPKNVTPKYFSTAQDNQGGSTDSRPGTDYDTDSDYNDSPFDASYVSFEEREDTREDTDQAGSFDTSDQAVQGEDSALTSHNGLEDTQDQGGSTDQAVQENGLHKVVDAQDQAVHTTREDTDQAGKKTPGRTPGRKGKKSAQVVVQADSLESADSDLVYMDLYTTATNKFDLPGTREHSIVEIVSDSVRVRRVETPDSLILAQIDAYKEQGYFVAGKDKWEQIQESKKNAQK